MLIGKRKILILGPAASGKSTFARKLGWKLNLPVVHQDVTFFNDDRTPVDHQVAIEFMRNQLSDNGWIVEGNYDQIIDLCLPQADLVIFLNFGRVSSLFRVLKRRICERHPDKDITIGGKHRVPLHFIKYILNIYPNVQRRQLDKIQQEAPSKLYSFANWCAFLKFQEKIEGGF